MQIKKHFTLEKKNSNKSLKLLKKTFKKVCVYLPKLLPNYTSPFSGFNQII